MLAKELAGGVEFIPIGETVFTVKSMGYLSRDRVHVGVEPNAWGIEFISFGKGATVTTVEELSKMRCEHCSGSGFIRNGDRNICGSCGRIKR